MLKSMADRLGIPHSSSSSSLPTSQSSSRSTSPNPTSSSSQRISMLSAPRSPSRQQQIPKPSTSVTGTGTSAGATAIPGATTSSNGVGISMMRRVTLTAPKPVLPPLPTNDHSSLTTPVANAENSPLAPAPASAATAASSTASAPNKTENVTVTVRIRPFSSSELKASAGTTEVWCVSDDGTKIGYADDYAVSARRAPVDYAFDSAMTGSDNEQIYNASVKRLVQSAMEGYNGTVFAYGQTSSGKTYTMSGSESQPGITPRAVEDIFMYIRENSDREFLLRVSYLEIYNESIRDLLSPEAIDLRIHEDRRRGVYVSPLKEEIVTTPSQVMRIIERGNYQRHVSSTDFNAHSSRSHSIFQIVIESRDRSPTASGENMITRKPIAGTKSASAVRVSQLNLIDLAGSEKAASNEERRKEGAFINKSLLTLGTVISKLTEEKGAHIPYRDSKLTRILQSSLSGNARVSVICTISPSFLNVEESHNTLKFAARVKKVVTKAQTNQVMDDKALLEKYRREISELKAQLMLTAGAAGGEGSGSGAEAVVAIGGKQQAELSKILEKERLKHEEEMGEMNMVRNVLKERIDHLTKLILTSQSINTKATVPDLPVGRYTVETSADGTVLEFPKEIESRLARKDALVKQLQSELEAQQEKMSLMKAALEKTARGEAVDIEKTLARVETHQPREKFLNEKRASLVNVNSLDHLDGVDGADLAALKALQNNHTNDAKQTQDGVQRVDSKGESEDDELMDTPWNREELQSLRQAKRELEIIVIEQEKKLEDMVAFEDSDEFQNLILEFEEQRERFVVMEEERDGLRSMVAELQNKIRRLELRSSSSPSLQMDSGVSAGSGMAGSSSPSLTPTATSATMSGGAAAARIKELEMIAQKERRLRMEEQGRNMGRIASLEAELTMMKAELSVRNLAGFS
ncbi:hypothetical protein BGZ51_004552 [Haplosporangium sp. Z 767]|nr:hypothetical protein BGZ51_004552 [Haplosporangium sp. Z 767]KAF9196994.1 hypothetical protein BGZ50_002705 [Haplosporangium sp. Z 11]